MKRKSKERKWSRNLIIAVGVIVGSLILTHAKGQKLEKALLWEVKGNGIKTSYVYGTFHLLPQADFNLNENVINAFDASEQIVLELDMDDPNMQYQMMQNIAMKDGTTLNQFLTEEDLNLLDEQLKAVVGLGVAQVNTFKPFMVETFILPTFIEGTPASYELTFKKRAESQQKEILGLETVAEQTAIFDVIPYEEQARDLVEILRDRGAMEELFSFMINTYKDEDIAKLYEASADYFSTQELELLLINRNKTWIPKMAALANEKTTFFGVGAGHLGGEAGIINLLKEAGYEVKPVK